MTIYRTANYDEMSRTAANIIAGQIRLKPDSVLGLATGSSPTGLYQNLIEWHQNPKITLDFSKITTINLDEYCGLGPQHPQSYRFFMNQHLFNHINIDKTHTFVPDGLEPDAQKACLCYDQAIAQAGGIDLQLLGLGNNGHIGFNEPGDAFPCGTHCADLTPSTVEANKRFFTCEADVPRQAYTMGIRNILQAKKILLIASGKAKADALHAALYGPVTPRIPASILQLHADVTIVADEEALGGC